jgi:hypothetical protein
VVRPLDFTAGLIGADAVWRAKDDGGLPLTGAGVTVCDVDAGIDPRRLSSEEAEAERRRQDAEASRIAVLAELREASRAHKEAAWHHKLATRRRLRAAVERASREGAAGPG